MRRDFFRTDIGSDDLRFGCFEHRYELRFGSVSSSSFAEQLGDVRFAAPLTDLPTRATSSIAAARF
jgi:hypothetical protein